MKKLLNITVPPEIGLNDEALEIFLKKHTNWPEKETLYFKRIKQSIDARKKEIKIHIEVEIDNNELSIDAELSEIVYSNVEDKPAIIIVGSGPAGLFAALKCIESGFKPIIFERGKDVRTRRRDIAALNKQQIVNPESNYCFGEGGAGTYSDGKLYTRSKKRGDINKILRVLVKHGATDHILFDAHPHIGTNKLPLVVANIRETILSQGGEIHFDSKVTDLIIENNVMTGVEVNKQKIFKGEAVILATGHSARDIFELLYHKKIKIEAKPFALGVRIEHSQRFVDQCQYHSDDRGILPAAAYSLVSQVIINHQQRGVFSFCMCPGGFIVPSSTDQNELVVNGMSPSRRDSKFANSGVVVSVVEEDWEIFKEKGPLAALEFQKYVEQKAYLFVKKKLGLNESEITQVMPAQKIKDFISGKQSVGLFETSYQPGIVSGDFNQILPSNLAFALKQALKDFNKKMRGYDEGQMIGIESRTSSPIRIPRDKLTFEHVEIKRFYPCGEGAGYAGGIVSAAMDGERCIAAFIENYHLSHTL